MKPLNTGLLRLAALASALVFLLGWGCVRDMLAQGCGGWMTAEYSSYENYSFDGTYIYTSVLVNGTTTGNCPFGCDFNCNQVTHLPRAYNVIGGVGGWENGNPGLWNSQINAENDQKILATVGTEYTFSSSTEVNCSLVGLFYLYTGSPIGLRIAVTCYKYKSTSGGVCTYDVFCGSHQYTCGTSTLQTPAPCPPQEYINTSWLAARIGQSTICFPVGKGTPSNIPATCQ